MASSSNYDKKIIEFVDNVKAGNFSIASFMFRGGEFGKDKREAAVREVTKRLADHYLQSNEKGSRSFAKFLNEMLTRWTWFGRDWYIVKSVFENSDFTREWIDEFKGFADEWIEENNKTRHRMRTDEELDFEATQEYLTNLYEIRSPNRNIANKDSRAQIVAALKRTGGDPKAAAKFLLNE